MNVYELVTSEEYKKNNAGILGAFKRRCDNYLKIKKYAMKERGWQEKEAEKLAGRIIGKVA